MKKKVPPDLAVKVLDASTRNVVKDVSDGAKLSASEKGDFEAATISADNARDSRAQALLVKWATAGRLTTAEERELESYHPGILSRGLSAAIATVTASQAGAPPADFTLAAEPSRDRLSAELVAKYGVRYGNATRRTIYRWVEIGREKHDPCPLDDPDAFIRWWPRHMKWRVPDWLLKAAAETKPVEPVPAATPGKTLPDPASPNFHPINLSEFELGEGEAVAQQRRLVAALYSALERAYLQPGGDVDLIQSKYNKAVEALRKLEKDDREDQKQRGLLIPRVAVQRDLETAAELIRQMSESESRRVRELVPDLSPAQTAALDAAIKSIAIARTRVFRNLRALKSTDGSVLELAAA